MKLYRDLDHKNQIYAKKYTLYRFNIEPTGKEVRIDGMLCYPISEEDAVYIFRIEEGKNENMIVSIDDEAEMEKAFAEFTKFMEENTPDEDK